MIALITANRLWNINRQATLPPEKGHGFLNFNRVRDYLYSRPVRVW
ncbi:MAG: hypothetical protein WC989_03790 [Micavibrio sp.]